MPPSSTLNSIVKKGYDPSYVNDFSRDLLAGFYLRDGETADDALARAAEAFCFGDYDLGQRIYEAVHAGWFMFASPVLSNAPIGRWTGTPQASDWTNNTTASYWDGEKSKAMPISCFALYVPDNIDGQIEATQEVAALSVSGGGVGLHNGIRAISDKAPGPIPYMKTVDAIIGYYRQGKTRRGSCAWYMDVSHPDILEHIKFRVPSGGDSARKADNRRQFNCAVNVSDEFIDAVVNDLDFDLKCPHTGEVRETLKARFLWEEILEARSLTGEPYIMKIDTVNRALPSWQRDKGLVVHGSNLCSEITLPTSEDRTFVCCLSSLNLETYDEWKDSSVVSDLIVFLDNVVQYFIENAPHQLTKAVTSAKAERALGLGTMGWHHYLQKNSIPFEGGGVGSAIQKTHQIYGKIKADAVAASLALGEERGEPEDMVGSGLRNSHLLAIAPNSNNSIIMGTSSSIEPVSGNVYSHSTRAGTHLVQNPHLDAVLRAIAFEQENPEAWLKEQWDSIHQNNGSVQHLDYLDAHNKAVYKTAFELDQHWIVEQADARQQYICQAQSLNLFFAAGVDRAYFNSVHLKALTAPYLKTLYYARMERGINADVVKQVERQALVDWTSDDCKACEG